MSRFVLITGCSGGGKSTLLAELDRRGYPVVNEPGRRIIAEERRRSGHALPWVDMAAFALRAVAMATSDLRSAEALGKTVFFDRGLIDAAVALMHADGVPINETLGDGTHYFKTVFFAPPWPELFLQEPDRRHDLTDAIGETQRLETALSHLGYDVCVLPKGSVQARADFVLETLAGSSSALEDRD